MGDFVTPELERLPLSGGRTIDINKRLTHGESEDMFARMLANRNELRTAKILAYLVGWSLTRDDKPVPYNLGLPEKERVDLIRAIDADLAIEMHQAIEAHEEKVASDRKKTQAETPGSAAISPSHSSADGPSATSAPSA